MPFPNIGFPWADGGGKPEDESDYRAVPASDNTPGYGDKGMLGSYRYTEKQYPDPAGVRHFTGYGATEADIERGFCMPGIGDDPAYQLENYKYRATEAKLSDEDEGGDSVRDDYSFRQRERRAKGFLTRPHLPTDR